MRIWLVTAAEPIPSDHARPMRFMGLARALVARGHEVTLWTQTFFHHTKRQRFPADTEYEAEGYEVIVLRALGYRKNISPRRYLSQWHFARRLAAEMPRRPAPDVVIASLPPLDTVTAVAKLCRRNGIPLIVDIIDPWPDVFVDLLPPAARGIGRALATPLYRQTREIFSVATAATALSATYAAWAQRMAAPHQLPAAVLYPGADIAGFDMLAAGTVRTEPGQGPMRIVYAGALGRAYDLDTVIEAVRLLEERRGPSVELLIAGNGPERARLAGLAQRLGSVRWFGWLDASALARLLASGDLGLACYKRGATQTVTYKLFDYLAAGLPILSSLEGEMGEIIRRERVGYLYPAEQPAALAEVVGQICSRPAERSEAARRARAFAESAGDARRIYGKMAAFIEAQCGSATELVEISA